MKAQIEKTNLTISIATHHHIAVTTKTINQQSLQKQISTKNNCQPPDYRQTPINTSCL